MSMKVHNAELYVEAMQSADWGPTQGQQRSKGASIKPLTSNGEDSGNLVIDSLSGKRAVLEAEFHAKMEIAKRESDRRTHEKSMRQERQFDDRYAGFMAKNKEIVEQSKMHEEVSSIRERKRERLYQDWMKKVFLPMQSAINSKIESANTDAVINFRNQQYQAYLNECNRKEKHGGVHRDVILETQYNPFVANEASTVKYATVSLAEDPLKNRVTRESKAMKDNQDVGQSGSLSALPSSSANIRQSNFRAGGAASSRGPSSSRFVASNGTYAQAYAHASKFALLPSEALGSVGGLPEGFVSGTPSGRGQPTFLPSVGGVSLNLSVTNPKLEPSYKFSANNSLYSPNTEPIPLRSTLVDVKQWGRMDATPHGRYSHDNKGPTGRPRVNPPGSKANFLRSDVSFDHYHVATGDEGVRQARKELGLNVGKRCNYIDKSNPAESPII
eukprot:GILI01017824.1.p1 GENE.GILI01017824.1~~GILI01017824.1.p1  ORF type:complete len:457 (-),score=51.25 GILI01017824.1:95-1423(-)